MSQVSQETASEGVPTIRADQEPHIGPYLLGRTVGQSSMGKVKIAMNTHTNQLVAMKIVRKDHLENNEPAKRRMRREISIFKVLSHPNIMKLLDVFDIDTHLIIVREFHGDKDLSHRLEGRKRGLPIAQALWIFQQIICGLEYCHKRLICHRDLRPEHIVVNDDLHVTITYFGVATLNPPGHMLQTSYGTPQYSDPMVWTGEYDGFKADIWSCGVILYAMATGCLPFDHPSIQRVSELAQAGEYHLPQELPESLKDIIQAMLKVDPEKRITLAEIKRHPWFLSREPQRACIDDTFVAQSEPILDPERKVIRSLMDLGWGNKALLKSELARDGPNMVKMFYHQALNHPTVQNVENIRDRVRESGTTGNFLTDKQEGNSPGGGERIGETPNDSNQLTEDEDGCITEDGNVYEGIDRVESRNSTTMPRNYGEETLRAGEAAEDAIQRASLGQLKSWFDSMLGFLVDQGDQEESKSDSVEQENEDRGQP